MLIFDRIVEQLRQLEQDLCSIQLSMSGSSTRPHRGWPMGTHIEGQLQQAVLDLRDSTAKLNLINETYSQLHEDRPLDNLIELAIDLVWQKAPISFAALILGEAELGPYHYYGMKGIPDSWRYIKKECIFTLSGLLARALLQRLDPNEPDYLYIPDIKAYGRPLHDEFPWMLSAGSLLIIPLRAENLAKGALLLGHSQIDRFDELLLRDEYVDIAGSITSAIRNAQMRQEMAKNVEQLVNVQLLTREITHAQQYQDVTDILTKKIPEVIGKVDVQVFMQHPVQAEDKAKFVTDMHQAAGPPSAIMWNNSVGSPSTMLNFSEYSTLTSTLPLENIQNADTNRLPSEDPLAAIAPEVRQLFQWTMDAAEPVFYDLESLPENPEHPYYSDSGKALIVPIIGHSRTYGVIHIISLSPLRRFEESDMVVLRTIANSAATAIGSVELIHTREQAEIEAIYKLICALEEPSHHAPCHSQRVVHNAVLLTQHLGLPHAECQLIGRGAALHNLKILSARETEHECANGHLGSNLCPTVDPHVLHALNINPVIVHMLTLTNASYMRHRQQFVNGVGAQNKDRIHQLDQQLYPRMSSVEKHSSLTAPLVDPHCLQSTDEISFALTHFDVSQLGACAIYMADAIDHIYADAVMQNCHAPTKLLDYLNAHAGTLFEPTMVEIAKGLLAHNLFVLPTEAQEQQSTTAAII